MKDINDMSQLLLQLQSDKKSSVGKLNTLLGTQITENNELYDMIVKIVQAILQRIK